MEKMDDKKLLKTTDNSPARSPLKRVFDKCAEEMICDEQGDRVLAPVLKMIEEGKFDKPPLFSLASLALPALAAGAAIAIIAGFIQHETVGDDLVRLPDVLPPLSGRAPVELIEKRLAALNERIVSDEKLMLLNIESQEIFEAVMVGDNGVYEVSAVPDGVYWVIEAPARIPDALDRAKAGKWVVTDGKAEPVYE
jgi:hypothetical protein